MPKNCSRNSKSAEEQAKPIPALTNAVNSQNNRKLPKQSKGIFQSILSPYSHTAPFSVSVPNLSFMNYHDSNNP